MRNYILLLLPFIALVFIKDVEAQNYGCTDSNAINFNSSATINDGSCQYESTFFNPEIKFTLPSVVNETSGLLFFNNGIWTFNDSQGEAKIYKVDTISGLIVQEITISNANNIDWEDITQDEFFIYIGDFGNNYGNRDDLKVYKLAKSLIPLNGNKIIEAEVIEFSYDDQRVLDKKNRAHNFDCEAIISYQNKLLLFSKNWANQRCKVYSLSKTPGNEIAVKISEFDSQGLITGASTNSMQNTITLVGYVSKVWLPFVWILWDFQADNILSGNKRRIEFPQLLSAQMEGVEFVNHQRVFISSEKTKFSNQSLFSLNTSIWTSGSETGIIKDLDLDEYSLLVNPNPVNVKNFEIEFKVPENEPFNLAIFDLNGTQLTNYRTKYLKSKNSVRLRLKRKDFAKGLYLVKLSVNNHSISKKFIIN